MGRTLHPVRMMGEHELSEFAITLAELAKRHGPDGFTYLGDLTGDMFETFSDPKTTRDIALTSHETEHPVSELYALSLPQLVSRAHTTLLGVAEALPQATADAPIGRQEVGTYKNVMRAMILNQRQVAATHHRLRVATQDLINIDDTGVTFVEPGPVSEAAAAVYRIETAMHQVPYGQVVLRLAEGEPVAVTLAALYTTQNPYQPPVG